ncbi:PIN domain-containing protein [Spirulina sp. CCNP1310]|uniref:type II toxin-antitoxin system VapC family toxin n=1 Tax=Spirulina sp. CCNP1310 TaxID=3110249 RepID=UPI002B20D8BE|nr:PIN domain-containing protein [Spirulina sp. CCNP1310]MEA5418096.1 PIN domain-containing protein [Spirulina sp. CCNP1310]
MKTVFADTGYWIALLNSSNNLHSKSKEITQALYPLKIITTEMIFVECLNAFSGQRKWLKSSMIKLVKRSQDNENITIIPHDQELFLAALEFYANRLDQSWSLTDCASFCVMKEQNIMDALAYDKHFVQAGFNALLR